MVNRLALIGGGEFSDDFEDMHSGLLTALGGKPRVVFLPTPAANDGIETVEHWCSLAREKLSALGANVNTPRVIDAKAQTTRSTLNRLLKRIGSISAAGTHMWLFLSCKARK